MAIEASIAHSSRKLNNAQKLEEQVSKDVERQDTKVRGYQGDLQSVQKAANEAQGKWQAYPRAIFFTNSVTEAQRRASQSNLSLSEASLEEYRRLFVCFIFLNGQNSCVGILRKARASVLAVEERQSLDRLTREEKAASRTFAQLRDRQEELEQRKASLREDNDVHEAKKSDVRMFVRPR